MPTQLKVASFELFKFEEPCISLNKGSGAIFFCGCNLDCVFCQNYQISSLLKGKFLSVDQLIQIMQNLEQMGAENINLVSPMHYAVQIVEALKKYKPKVPVIYNTNAYESVQTIEFVAPYVDVFLPDFKYYSNDLASQLSGANNYFQVALDAIKTMRKLKPDIFAPNGKILQGVIIRHMILPLCTSDSINVLKTIGRELPNTKVSLLAQYTPYAKAKQIKGLNRKITQREYDLVLQAYNQLNLDGYVQERSSSSEQYIPHFKFVD